MIVLDAFVLGASIPLLALWFARPRPTLGQRQVDHLLEDERQADRRAR